MNWKEDKKFVCLYNSARKIGEKVQYINKKSLITKLKNETNSVF